jgi:hypothetical protein
MVNHSAGQYVNGIVHTNGIENVWALLKRGYHGVFHHFSDKHIGRYPSSRLIRGTLTCRWHSCSKKFI